MRGETGSAGGNAARSAALRSRLCLLAALLATSCATAPPERPAPDEAASAVRLVLMGTTDVHGRIYPWDYYSAEPIDYGLATISPFVDSIRAANPGRTFLFDSGDLLQGNPLGFVYARIIRGEPSPIIRAMNLLRYDASAIGNHEFNYGLALLDSAIAQAGFPFLSANIFRHAADEHAYRPYAILPYRTADGDTILIGVTASTPPGVMLWDRANVEGIVQVRDAVTAVAAAVARMRREGADLIVVLSHGGLEGSSYDRVSTGLAAENDAIRLAREVPGIDVVFLGHTHRELADTTINGVRLIQAGNWATSLAVVDVTLERHRVGEWTLSASRGRLIRPRAGLEDRALMDSLRWQHERTVAWVGSRIGEAPEPLSAAAARVRDTPLIDFINEVQRKAGNADLSSTAAFDVGAAIDTGAITIGEIARLYPYDNTLKVIRITGAQLDAYLEKSAEYYHGWPRPAGGSVTDRNVPGYNFDIVSGVEYTIDLRRAKGSRVSDLTWRGRTVTPEQTFTLALNNYRQSGGGGYSMLASAPVVFDRQQDIRELLIEEVRRTGEIRPETYFRESWRLLPAEAAAAALAEQAPETGSAPAARAGRRLRVLATSDFHGRLLPETPPWSDGRAVGGAAALASWLSLEREGFAGPTVLLDGGDVMQGTAVSNLTEGRASVRFFNLAGYGAGAIGNHEYDYGIDVLRKRIADATWAWLSANTFIEGSDTAPGWMKPTSMLDVDGVRVGVIGLSSEQTPTATRPANVRGLRFGDGAAAIDRHVPELRAAGADFVIVVAHAGAICDVDGEGCDGEIVHWAQAVHERPDLIVAGHTHRPVRARVNGIPIVEAASWGSRYAVVDLRRVTDDSVDVWIRGIPIAWTDEVPTDNAAAALVQRFVTDVGPALNRPVTWLAGDLVRNGREHGLGRLVADANRRATHAQVAIINNTGIRTDLRAGAVTWGRLYEVEPFGNRLFRLMITGAQLRDALEHALAGARPSVHISGMSVFYDPSAAAGGRVRTIRLDDGTVVRDGDIVTVGVPDFLAEGGDGYAMFRDALERKDSGTDDLEALIDYLEGLPAPVEAPTDERLRPVAGPGSPEMQR